jgi:hypothetical protein
MTTGVALAATRSYRPRVVFARQADKARMTSVSFNLIYRHTVISHCAHCGHNRELDLQALQDAGWGNTDLIELPLRCTACGRMGVPHHRLRCALGGILRPEKSEFSRVWIATPDPKRNIHRPMAQRLHRPARQFGMAQQTNGLLCKTRHSVSKLR